jgi:hypothetical protein
LWFQGRFIEILIKISIIGIMKQMNQPKKLTPKKTTHS